MNTRFLSAASMLLVAGAVYGASPIDEKHSLDADGRLEVSNVRGKVIVQAWDQNQVAISGSLGEGSTLNVSGNSAHRTIEIKSIKRGGWWGWGGDGAKEDSNITLHVPASVDLEIDLVSADAQIIAVGSKQVEVDSVSGDISIDSNARKVSADSVSGDISYTGSAHELSMETVSGDMRANGLRGRLNISSVSGDAEIEAVNLLQAKGDSVSGDIHIKVSEAIQASIELESMSGSINLQIPANSSFRLNAETFSGSIRSGVGKVQENDGPGSSLSASKGSGANSIDLESFSGDIRFKLVE